MWYQCFNGNREQGFLHDEKLFTGSHWFPKQVYCCWHPYCRDKDLIGSVQALSHPDRWLLLWVVRLCYMQYVRPMMPTQEKWSVCLALMFHTAITASVLKSMCFKSLLIQTFSVFLDFAETLRGKKGSCNDNPITTFHPSARRIQWYEPKIFW